MDTRILVTRTALLALLALGSMGCGHHHHGSYPYVAPPPPTGTLEVYNLPSSRDVLERVETERVGTRQVEIEVVRATPGTGVFFDRLEGHYTVWATSETGLRNTFFDVPIFERHTTTIDALF
jgi:hypothetical protein